MWTLSHYVRRHCKAVVAAGSEACKLSVAQAQWSGAAHVSVPLPWQRRAASSCCVLGIETSCDDTAVGIVRRQASTGGVDIVSDVVSSQQHVHAPYAGIVPQLARREHELNMEVVLGKALHDAEAAGTDIDAVAVTVGPGLKLCLKVGFVTAVVLAHRLQVPFVAINHLEAHALVPRLMNNVEFPYLALLVSGGHTALLHVTSPTCFSQLATTIDDSLGEAFDKVARLLHVGYHQQHGASATHVRVPSSSSSSSDPQQRGAGEPVAKFPVDGVPIQGHGGKALEDLAREGNPKAVPLAVPLRRSRKHGLAFSYSGLKTSILYASQASDVLHRQTAADLAASFQATATQHLVDRLRLAFALPELSGTKTLVLCGGVAANEYIRNKVQAVATQHGREFVAPAPQHCTDNGVMVAYAGLEHFELGTRHDPAVLDFHARWPVGSSLPVSKFRPGVEALDAIQGLQDTLVPPPAQLRDAFTQDLYAALRTSYTS